MCHNRVAALPRIKRKCMKLFFIMSNVIMSVSFFTHPLPVLSEEFVSSPLF